MDILDDMWVSKLSAKVFSKVNYSFKDSFKDIHIHSFLIYCIFSAVLQEYIGYCLA